MSAATNIPKGYKQTKVGVIPKDWKVIKLGELLDFKNGINAEKEAYGSGVKFINIMEIINNNSIYYNMIPGSVTLEEKQLLPNVVEYGDVLLNRTSETRKEIGLTAVYLDNEKPVFGGFVIRGRCKDSRLNHQFKKNCFQSPILRKQIISKGQGAVRANIGQKELEQVLLPLPPLPEQQKIASILTSWEKAIFTTQSIIGELKLRNKGLAQQLLTGKKRLKGFDGEWEELRADKIFKSYTNKSHNGELEILSATQERGVIPRSMNNIDIKFDQRSLGNYKKVEIGDYVISLRSFQGGIEYSEYEGIVSPAYTVLKEILPISKTFFKVYFKTDTFINRLNTIIYGIRDGKQINYKDFSTLKLPYPPIKEQEAIASFLKKGNQELNLYEKKLTTLKEQKKGLMQKLLTGEIRVKTDKTN